jgi:hypothetical protein
VKLCDGCLFQIDASYPACALGEKPTTFGKCRSFIRRDAPRSALKAEPSFGGASERIGRADYLTSKDDVAKTSDQVLREKT